VRSSVPVGIAVALLCSVCFAQQVTPVQMPSGMWVHAALLHDLDGDGKADLVISAVGEARELRVHLQKAGKVRFGAEPDYKLSPVWKDVVAFAVADVHPDPGAEIVLFSSKGVWAWRPRAPEKERAYKLVECSLLWQLPSSYGAHSFRAGTPDIDGDGLADLLIPEPDGYRIVMQGPRGQFERQSMLVVPADRDAGGAGPISVKARSRRLRSRFEVRFSVGRTSMTASGSADGAEAEANPRAAGPLLEIQDTVPAPQLLDFDGDGDKDVIVRTEERLFVWTQRNGAFKGQPAVNLEVPVKEDRARRLEVSYSAHVADLDHDNKADCVIFSGDQRSKEVRTQVQIFSQRKNQQLFKDGMPDQLLVLAGFAGNPRLVDVDGDGYPDLMAGAFRPDLLDTIRASSKNLEMELYVFRNNRGKFSRRPDILHRADVEMKGLRFSRRQRIAAEFFGDVTGDGVKDLLLRQESERIKVLMTRVTRNGWQIMDRQQLYELRIHARSTLEIGPDRGRRKAPDILVLEPAQVLHVRFQ